MRPSAHDVVPIFRGTCAKCKVDLLYLEQVRRECACGERLVAASAPSSNVTYAHVADPTGPRMTCAHTYGSRRSWATMGRPEGANGALRSKASKSWLSSVNNAALLDASCSRWWDPARTFPRDSTGES